MDQNATLNGGSFLMESSLGEDCFKQSESVRRLAQTECSDAEIGA